MTVVEAVERPALLKPPPIVKGDAIGVVAPSYSPRAGWLQRGVKALERAGYEVLLDPELGQLRRFARAEDERRAENLMGMWLDPRVKALIGGTGGYGAVRQIPVLGEGGFRREPQPLVGYLGVSAPPPSPLRRCGLRVVFRPTGGGPLPPPPPPT